jgi:O-antigen ligase
MGPLFTFAYVAYMLVSPVSWFPDLAAANVQMYIVLIAVLATAPKLGTESPFRHTPQMTVAVVLFVWLICSPLTHLWFGGAMKAFSDQFPLLILLFLIRINCATAASRKRLVLGLVLLMTALTAVGIYQYHANPDVPDNKFVLRYDVGDPGNSHIIHRLKGQGLVDDPNDFAQLLLICAMLATLFWSDSKLLNLIRVVVPFCILLYGVFQTHSRGALVAIAAAIASSLRKKLKLWGSVLVAVLVVGGLLAANFTGGREVSVEGGMDRLDIWSDGLGLLKQTYFMGVTYGQFSEQIGITAHNSVLLVAAELGLLGLILFVALWVLSFIQVSRIRSAVSGATPDVPVLREARALELALVAFVTTSWFLSRAFTAAPFLLIGLVAGFVAEQGKRSDELELTPRWPVWLRTSILISMAALGVIWAMVRFRGI